MRRLEEIPLLLLLLCTSAIQSAMSPAAPMDAGTKEELCRNFTVGSMATGSFYSPSTPGKFPETYPRGISCTRVITAEYGFFVRIDFRDFFHIEPPSSEGKCDYDYLEIRDGDQGYSTLIGKFCGSDFPPIITSSGRSLWLRFVSDGTIEYSGFKAVFDFIPNPLETLPMIAKCEFEVGGAMDWIGSANVSSEQTEYAAKYGEPVDCTWTVRAEEGAQIFLQFHVYELAEPNDCNYNFLQVFDGINDMEGLEKEFCGSIADRITSKTNILYIRFFADEKGLASEFAGIFTVLHPALEDGESVRCKSDQYDCDDTFCIDQSLYCNGVRNCKFGWDEESCSMESGGIPIDFSQPENVIIICLLLAIVIGMCSGMIYNLVRKLTEDKEDVLASREKSLASLAASATSLETSPHFPQKSRSRLTLEDEDGRNGCYVPPPPGGFPFNNHK